MTSIGSQLSLYHDDLSPLSEVIERLDQIGFTGVEFAYRIFESDVDEAAATLSRTGIEPIGGHFVPHFHDFEETCDIFDRIGCDRVIVTHLAEPRFKDQTEVEKTASYLQQIGDRFRDRGFDLAYHNDGLEDTMLDSERTALEELLDVTDDLQFELDLAHAVEVGLDPVDLLDRYEGRFYAVHVKDWAPDVGDSVGFGQGVVDVDSAVQRSRDMGIDWLVYEGDPHADDLSEVYQRMSGIKAVE